MIGLSIVMSFPPPRNRRNDSQIESLTTAVLEAISSRPFYRARPVTWNAPTVHLMDRSRATAADVGSRLVNRDSDQFIPMGFAGAPHHLLLREESISEIEWSVSNMWGTGCVDTGFERPPFIFVSSENLSPPLTDGDTPVAFASRLDRFPVLVVAGDAGQSCLPMIDASTLDTTSPQTAARSMARTARRITRSRRGGEAPGEIVLLTVLTGQDDVGRIPNLLDGIERYCERGTAELRPLPDLRSWGSMTGSVMPFGRAAAPDARVQAAVARMRKGRSSRINRRRILELIVGLDESTPPSRPSGSRNFTASMMGEVALPGQSSDALFSGGRFCGFVAARDGRFSPAVSYRWSAGGEGRPQRFEPSACFSFESHESRGVRVVERSETMQLISDFSFVREQPLLVSTHALFADEVSSPAGSRANGELLHLALPLARDGKVRVRAEYPDGWSVEAELGDSGDARELFGSRFRIHFGDEILAIAFLTRSGLPLVSSVGIYRVPELVLGIGGRFSLPPIVTGDATAEFAMLMGSGLEAVEEIDRLQSGGSQSAHGAVRLPAPLLRELGNGPGATDSRRPQPERPG